MARSLNKVQLIGNLTRDPELRYTPQGSAVCNFGIATNRQWTTDTGEKKEDVEFHRIVAWNKLAELCAQLLAKGRKVFVEGRLQTRKWTGQDGFERRTTEVIISEMILLDSKGSFDGTDVDDYDMPEEDIDVEDAGEDDKEDEKKSKGEKKPKKKGKKKKKNENKNKKNKKSKGKKAKEEDDDIPF